MMKKGFLLFILVLVFNALFSAQLIQFYYRDYQEITRMVFVFDQPVYYNVNMDTDKKYIDIKLSDCIKSKTLPPFEINADNILIQNLFLQSGKRDLNIRINTKITYFGETFTLKKDQFKLVVDVYKQEFPDSKASAEIFLNFYDTVSFFNRAKALRSKFADLAPKAQVIVINEAPANPSPVIIPEKISVTGNDNLFAYTMPAIKENHPAYQWIRQAFHLRDELQSGIVRPLNDADQIITEYNNSSKVEISFLEKMSDHHNLLSKLSIQCNTLRFKCDELIKNAPAKNDKDIEYTLNMLRLMSVKTAEYQKQIENTVNKYQSLLSK